MVSLHTIPKLIEEDRWIVATFLLVQKIQGEGSSAGKAVWNNPSLRGKSHGPEESIIPTEFASGIPGDTLNRIAKERIHHSNNQILSIILESLLGEEVIVHPGILVPQANSRFV